eukprot:scaffold43569_cov21-Tisochrysis_lutea.AAC.3
MKRVCTNAARIPCQLSGHTSFSHVHDTVQGMSRLTATLRATAGSTDTGDAQVLNALSALNDTLTRGALFRAIMSP